MRNTFTANSILLRVMTDSLKHPSSIPPLEYFQACEILAVAGLAAHPKAAAALAGTDKSTTHPT